MEIAGRKALNIKIKVIKSTTNGRNLMSRTFYQKQISSVDSLNKFDEILNLD